MFGVQFGHNVHEFFKDLKIARARYDYRKFISVNFYVYQYYHCKPSLGR